MSIWVDLLGAQVRMAGRRYQTRVIEAGDGPPVVLVHGIGGHAEAWSRNVIRLAQRFHVYAIDLLWHGLSQKPAVPERLIPMWVEQILDLMDSEGFDQFYLEGESLGGWITLWGAWQHPERIKKIVANTTAGVVFSRGPVQEHPEQGIERLRARSLAALRNPTRETVRQRLEWLMAAPDRVTEELVDVRRHYYADPATQEALAAVFERMLNIPQNPDRLSEQELGQIQVPALVFWTTQNPGNGPDFGRRVADAIPGARFYCMEDAAHWPQWEHPEEHDRVVSEFFLS
jgi:pimeloyl-ACP methyl ester carboxylesterase